MSVRYTLPSTGDLPLDAESKNQPQNQTETENQILENPENPALRLVSLMRANENVADFAVEQPNPFPMLPDPTDPSWQPVSQFLLSFHGSIFCLIPDADSVKHLPVTHTTVIDPAKQVEGYGIFYSVNGFTQSGNGLKRTLQSLTTVNAFYVDIDYPKEIRGLINESDPDSLRELYIFKRDTLESLSELSMEGMGPSYIIETKNGYHAIWCLEAPIVYADLPDQKKMNLQAGYVRIEQAIIRRFNGDSNAHDLTRVLRLPNTWHIKNPKHPFLTKIVSATGNVFTYKQIKDFFLPYGTSNTLENHPHEQDIEQLLWREASKNNEPFSPEAFKWLDEQYPKVERPSFKALMDKSGISEGSRNNSLLVAASACRESGWPEARTLAYFDAYNGLPLHEIQNTIKSVYRREPPYSFGWSNPLVARGLSTVEKAKVVGLLREFTLSRRSIKSEEAISTGSASTPETTLTQTVPNSAVDSKALQDSLFAEYEFILRERYPDLRFRPADNTFYLYAHGCYFPQTDDEIRSLILQNMEKDRLLKYKTKTNVDNKMMCLKSIDGFLLKRDLEQETNHHAVYNGIVDFDTGTLLPHSPEIFTTTLLPITYRENELLEDLCPRWLQFIKEITCNDEDKAFFLQQIAGYCFTRETSLQTAFILYGNGANGKSTFIDILQKILGKNASSLSLEDLSTDFGLDDLYQKTLNVVEEISNNYFESNTIKKVITGAELMANRKFKPRLRFRPYAKFVLAVNQLPKIADTSIGIYRRFKVIEFNASFSGKIADPYLSDTLWKERDGIFLWAMRGWHSIRKHGLKVPLIVEASMDTFKENNSPLVEFLLTNYEIIPVTDAPRYFLLAGKIFDSYRTWVSKNGYGAKSYSNWLNEMRTLNHSLLANVRVVTDTSGDKIVQGLRLKLQ